MTSQDRRSRVVVISLGGTIASTPSDSAAGVVPQLTAQDLIAAVPQLHDVADIEAISFRQLPSGDLTLDDLVDLALLIEGLGAQDVDGVVITQGTDTIEETSFALDVLLDVDFPVVVTGAMRNPSLASADGPGNVLSAVKVAASHATRGLGCLVVMNDEVHAARFVRKTHSSNLATFRSPSCGPLGWVAEERVRIASRPAPIAHIAAHTVTQIAPVALQTCAIGDDGRTLSCLASLGYVGAVVEAFGAGHVPSDMVDTLEALAQTMPVVLCSRTGAGEVLQHTYGFRGSESDVLSRGVVSGGALDGPKARVALALSISGSKQGAIAMEVFARLRDSLSV